MLRMAIRTISMLLLGICLTSVSPSLAQTAADAETKTDNFSSWVQTLRHEALSQGITKHTLDAAFKKVSAPLPRVISLDRNQPELKLSLTEYLDQRLTPQRIESGKTMLRQHAELLERLERKYGVPPRFIVALWGIETNYGSYTGGFSVIQALATLAYDGRRSAYFRTELLQALHIIEAGHISAAAMQGSWAGAMGQCQFMPSSFRNYAVDGDGDGVIDIWNSIPDVLASAANYLHQVGWQYGYTWGRQVQLSDQITSDQLGLDKRLPLQRWNQLGVSTKCGGALPAVDIQASLLQPDGPGSNAWLVYPNFRTIMKWNRSVLFGICIGTLADRIQERVRHNHLDIAI